MVPEELLDESRALKHLMDLLAVEGLSGREGKVAAMVRGKLLAAGCKSSWVRYDRANRRMKGDFEIGNLIARIPGTIKAPRRLFVGHLDTVPLCRGAKAVRRGSRIVGTGGTALGGDNRTAVACLVSVIEAVLKRNLPRPPLTVLFTVGEEIGLCGSRFVKLSDLSHPKMGFNIDSGNPSELVIGAVGADRWEIEVIGRSSHAGLHPEGGISASLIASRAIADVAEKGYFGKILRGKKCGTSNVGIIRGGEATNQVTDHVFVKGESRSHDRRFLKEITGAYKTAFERAAKSVKNSKGRVGSVKFRAAREYEAFCLDKGALPVTMAAQRARCLGLEPKLIRGNGGLDANQLNARGVSTVTLGAGQHNAHTVDEYIDVREYLTGCRLAILLATEMQSP
jgi:tripeptide aminopeptidase